MPLLEIQVDLRTPPTFRKFRSRLQEMPTNPLLTWIGIRGRLQTRTVTRMLMRYPLSENSQVKTQSQEKSKT